MIDVIQLFLDLDAIWTLFYCRWDEIEGTDHLEKDLQPVLLPFTVIYFDFLTHFLVCLVNLGQFCFFFLWLFILVIP